MTENPIPKNELGHVLTVRDAVSKISFLLGTNETEIYEAIPDLLRLSEQQFSVGSLPDEFKDRPGYEKCVMFSSTGKDPLGVIIKKTAHGLEVETFRRFWEKGAEH